MSLRAGLLTTLEVARSRERPPEELRSSLDDALRAARDWYAQLGKALPDRRSEQWPEVAIVLLVEVVDVLCNPTGETDLVDRPVVDQRA